jgi:hypothetical protein
MEYAQMEGNATPAQVSFAESLCSQMSRKGYLFCKKPDFGQMSKTEISIMIDAMKYINSHYHQRTEDRLVFREECEQNVQNAAQSGEAEVKFPFSVES